MGWRELIELWPLVELDLSDAGYDLYDPDLDRPWPWWRDRIWGLLSSETSRVRRVLLARQREDEKAS